MQVLYYMVWFSYKTIKKRLWGTVDEIDSTNYNFNPILLYSNHTKSPVLENTLFLKNKLELFILFISLQTNK